MSLVLYAVSFYGSNSRSASERYCEPAGGALVKSKAQEEGKDVGSDVVSDEVGCQEFGVASAHVRRPVT